MINYADNTVLSSDEIEQLRHLLSDNEINELLKTERDRGAFKVKAAKLSSARRTDSRLYQFEIEHIKNIFTNEEVNLLLDTKTSKKSKTKLSRSDLIALIQKEIVEKNNKKRTVNIGNINKKNELLSEIEAKLTKYGLNNKHRKEIASIVKDNLDKNGILKDSAKREINKMISIYKNSVFYFTSKDELWKKSANLAPTSSPLQNQRNSNATINKVFSKPLSPDWSDARSILYELNKDFIDIRKIGKEPSWYNISNAVKNKIRKFNKTRNIGLDDNVLFLFFYDLLGTTTGRYKSADEAKIGSVMRNILTVTGEYRKSHLQNKLKHNYLSELRTWMRKEYLSGYLETESLTTNSTNAFILKLKNGNEVLKNGDNWFRERFSQYKKSKYKNTNLSDVDILNDLLNESFMYQIASKHPSGPASSIASAKELKETIIKDPNFKQEIINWISNKLSPIMALGEERRTYRSLSDSTKKLVNSFWKDKVFNRSKGLNVVPEDFWDVLLTLGYISDAMNPLKASLESGALRSVQDSNLRRTIDLIGKRKSIDSLIQLSEKANNKDLTLLLKEIKTNYSKPKQGRDKILHALKERLTSSNKIKSASDIETLLEDYYDYKSKLNTIKKIVSSTKNNLLSSLTVRNKSGLNSRTTMYGLMKELFIGNSEYITKTNYVRIKPESLNANVSGSANDNSFIYYRKGSMRGYPSALSRGSVSDEYTDFLVRTNKLNSVARSKNSFFFINPYEFHDPNKTPFGYLYMNTDRRIPMILIPNHLHDIEQVFEYGDFISRGKHQGYYAGFNPFSVFLNEQQGIRFSEPLDVDLDPFRVSDKTSIYHGKKALVQMNAEYDSPSTLFEYSDIKANVDSDIRYLGSGANYEIKGTNEKRLVDRIRFYETLFKDNPDLIANMDPLYQESLSKYKEYKLEQKAFLSAHESEIKELKIYFSNKTINRSLISLANNTNQKDIEELINKAEYYDVKFYTDKPLKETYQFKFKDLEILPGAAVAKEHEIHIDIKEKNRTNLFKIIGQLKKTNFLRDERLTIEEKINKYLDYFGLKNVINKQDVFLDIQRRVYHYTGKLLPVSVINKPNSKVNKLIDNIVHFDIEGMESFAKQKGRFTEIYELSYKIGQSDVIQSISREGLNKGKQSLRTGGFANIRKLKSKINKRNADGSYKYNDGIFDDTETMVKRFLSDINGHLLVGYNIRNYDLPVVSQYGLADRERLTIYNLMYGSNIDHGNKYVDVMDEISKYKTSLEKKRGKKFKSLKLVDVADFFDIKVQKSHIGKEDVGLEKLVFEALYKELSELNSDDLRAIDEISENIIKQTINELNVKTDSLEIDAKTGIPHLNAREYNAVIFSKILTESANSNIDILKSMDYRLFVEGKDAEINTMGLYKHLISIRNKQYTIDGLLKKTEKETDPVKKAELNKIISKLQKQEEIKVFSMLHRNKKGISIGVLLESLKYKTLTDNIEKVKQLKNKFVHDMFEGSLFNHPYREGSGKRFLDEILDQSEMRNIAVEQTKALIDQSSVQQYKILFEQLYDFRKKQSLFDDDIKSRELKLSKIDSLKKKLFTEKDPIERLKIRKDIINLEKEVASFKTDTFEYVKSDRILSLDDGKASIRDIYEKVYNLYNDKAVKKGVLNTVIKKELDNAFLELIVLKLKDINGSDIDITDDQKYLIKDILSQEKVYLSRENFNAAMDEVYNVISEVDEDDRLSVYAQAILNPDTYIRDKTVLRKFESERLTMLDMLPNTRTALKRMLLGEGKRGVYFERELNKLFDGENKEFGSPGKLYDNLKKSFMNTLFELIAISESKEFYTGGIQNIDAFLSSDKNKKMLETALEIVFRKKDLLGMPDDRFGVDETTKTARILTDMWVEKAVNSIKAQAVERSKTTDMLGFLDDWMLKNITGISEDAFKISINLSSLGMSSFGSGLELDANLVYFSLLDRLLEEGSVAETEDFTIESFDKMEEILSEKLGDGDNNVEFNIASVTPDQEELLEDNASTLMKKNLEYELSKGNKLNLEQRRTKNIYGILEKISHKIQSEEELSRGEIAFLTHAFPKGSQIAGKNVLRVNLEEGIVIEDTGLNGIVEEKSLTFDRKRGKDFFQIIREYSTNADNAMKDLANIINSKMSRDITSNVFGLFEKLDKLGNKEMTFYSLYKVLGEDSIKINEIQVKERILEETVKKLNESKQQGIKVDDSVIDKIKSEKKKLTDLLDNYREVKTEVENLKLSQEESESIYNALYKAYDSNKKESSQAMYEMKRYSADLDASLLTASQLTEKQFLGEIPGLKEFAQEIEGKTDLPIDEMEKIFDEIQKTQVAQNAANASQPSNETFVKNMNKKFKTALFSLNDILEGASGVIKVGLTSMAFSAGIMAISLLLSQKNEAAEQQKFAVNQFDSNALYSNYFNTARMAAISYSNNGIAMDDSYTGAMTKYGLV